MSGIITWPLIGHFNWIPEPGPFVLQIKLGSKRIFLSTPKHIISNLNDYRNILPDTIRHNVAIKILVAEDNDEFRSFLFSQLGLYYTIILAPNGKDALEKAVEFLPDLIISDIMMPEMNGLELCEHLKKDVRTSHIPVILLTARSAEDIRYQGFQARADAYISKPFNLDILLIRIRNFIEQQEQRKELFRKAIIIQPSQVTSSAIDEKLIKKALMLMEKNMDNSSYSVEELSSDMNMERSGLYRKLVSIVGQTPTVFMRSVRLKKAAQLLTQGEFSVAEIADQVGFSNAAYFSKCFHEEFAVKPSQYADSVSMK